MGNASGDTSTLIHTERSTLYQNIFMRNSQFATKLESDFLREKTIYKFGGKNYLPILFNSKIKHRNDCDFIKIPDTHIIEILCHSYYYSSTYLLFLFYWFSLFIIYSLPIYLL